MRKVVAFLLAIIIFVSPVTTLVKADVVIGDNDDIVVNENANILGRKLAMLESLSELALSGVTEFTISNTEDVDTYLDSLWSEINDAIDYLDSGDWVDDIPNNLASKYYTNLIKYRDIVNNRGEFLGFDLQNPTTSLLKTYFANDIYGKKYTSTGLYQTLDMVRSLSALTRGSNPEPTNPDTNYDWVRQINNFYVRLDNDFYDFFNTDCIFVDSSSHITNPFTFYKRDYSYVGQFTNSHATSSGTNTAINSSLYQGIISIYITRNENNSCNVTYSTSNPISLTNDGYYRYGISYNTYYSSIMIRENLTNNETWDNSTYYNSFDTCINYIYGRFCNVNLYVDNVPWALVSVSPSSPTLDIDGYLKIYGNDQPQQYELKPNTQLDYDQLYQVIYYAIRDNLPISQGDINYYDSHDTIYSPTIINNYGEEEGDESDLIDTILDYAVIPKFDTAIAQPMRQALTNGVVIMNNSITNVIPNEILIILGACFFLLLFAVVINRMIK